MFLTFLGGKFHTFVSMAFFLFKPSIVSSQQHIQVKPVMHLSLPPQPTPPHPTPRVYYDARWCHIKLEVLLLIIIKQCSIN